MLQVDEICYEIGDLTLHGVACGDPHLPPVLLLHGWLDNAASFLPLLPELKPGRYIAIDWPGHGFSSHRSSDAHYHFIDWVYDLLKLFEHNQWQQIDIIGHSMGGMIASAFAAAFPEKVRSLALIDSIGLVAGEAESTTTQLRKGLLSRISNQSKQKNRHPNLASAIKARVAVSDLTLEAATLIVKRGIMQQGSDFIWRSDSRLRNTSPYRLTLAQAKQLMADVTSPVCVIRGEKGYDMVKQGIDVFSSVITDITIHELPGGHHLHMEHPGAVAAKIHDFWLSLNR
ncbi:alpha/beta fold hydrolase [Thalassotalea euphylliae]|uniref:alpha/beta fold hydrolase n=1 Tax=Thalassotalea euphylliae TaxID=1655234 RepID=UPI00362F1366